MRLRRHKWMGKKSKVKGSGYELKIAKALSAWWGHEFHRTPQSGGLRWNDDNNVAGDIVTPLEANFPFIVECKKREEWTLENLFLNNKDIKYWWEQVVQDCERVGRTPILIFSRNRARDFVMMPYRSSVESMLHEATDEPVMKTKVSYEDIHKDTHSFDVLVTTLEGLTALTPKQVIRSYSDEYFDWREVETIIPSMEKTPEVEDILNGI